MFVVGIVSLLVTSPVFSQDSVQSPDGLFDFHVDPWVSLHHFAYHYVREEERLLKLRGRVPLTEDDRRLITDEFRAVCAPLTVAYRPYIERSLLFDANTRALTKALKWGPSGVLDDDVRKALEACMPAYRETFWPRHKEAGVRLREHLLRQLKLYETRMADRFARMLEGSWPGVPIRVDLTPYANWAGAYTDDSPPHISISSLDNEFSGRFAFEILFHESGHTGSFAQSLLRAANAALEATALENERFWHYVLFHVSGVATADAIGDSTYVPFANAVGLAQTEDAEAYYRALEETWDAGGTFSDRVLRAAQKVRDNE